VAAPGTIIATTSIMPGRVRIASGARTGAALAVAASAACALAAQERDAFIGRGPAPRINGFADVRYVATDTAGSRNGFALGQFDLFVRSLLSERTDVLAEIVVHPGPRNQFRVVLERLLVTYSRSDRLNIAFGRFHTAIGWYNAAYHHGTWFQTATGRPLVAAFESEGGVLPIHTLGVSVTGAVSGPALGLRYSAEVGNGRASQAGLPTPPQPSLRDNNRLAVNLGLRARPERWRGLELGVSWYADRLTPDTLPPVRERIGAGFVVYRTSALELLGEAVLLRHASAGRTTAVTGGYVQAAYALGMARPYLRYDRVDAASADPLFGHYGLRQGPSAGVRWDVEEFMALKTQVGRLRRSRGATVGRIEVQAAVSF
jgi:hypothetical protein